jgi:DNA-binding NtrC family response regulator
MMKTRVLIVDDEQDFAQSLAERMENRGIEAVVVFSGEEAVVKVKEDGFDAVVLDMAMPGMDGMATLKAMLGINADLQVIVLTGHATVSTGVQAVKDGAFEFLEKPVKLETLVGKIDQAKSRTSALSEAKMNDMIDEIVKRRGW